MNETYCPNCGHLNRLNARFCAACGRMLVAAEAEAGDELPTMPSAAAGEQPLENEQTAPVFRRVEWLAGHKSDIGRQRGTNEDSLIALEFVCVNKSMSRNIGLFVIADGMGGHEGGEIASGMLVRVLARLAAEEWLPRAVVEDKTFDAADWLADSVQAGNEAIYESSHEAGFEMGTTVVAVLMESDQACIAHVGDSRAYRINGAGIEQLTVDHSLVESLVATNQISREEARTHPQANVIYRTVGDNPHVVVDLKRITLAPDDFLLLCSDGLSGMITDIMIREIVMGASSPQAACDALVEAANRAGGEDNCTVILIELKSI